MKRRAKLYGSHHRRLDRTSKITLSITSHIPIVNKIRSLSLQKLLVEMLKPESEQPRHSLQDKEPLLKYKMGLCSMSVTLVLTRGRGSSLSTMHLCQDVEGMCCFNLSDPSESAHKKLE